MTNKINKVPQHKTIPATPATPDTGFGKIYIKSDGSWYGLDDQGVETLLSGGGSGTGVSGSGTLNYLTKWTPDGTTLGNSIIRDNGDKVAIGFDPDFAIGDFNVVAQSGICAIDASTGLNGGYAINGGINAFGSDPNQGIIGSAFNSSLRNIGVMGQAGATINGSTNIGIYGYASGTGISIGLCGEASIGAAERYGAQLVDGTQASGKFLKSVTSDGKANWANITASDVSGVQGALTLTTTGSSGAATLVGNTLNIPQYSGGGGGGFTWPAHIEYNETDKTLWVNGNNDNFNNTGFGEKTLTSITSATGATAFGTYALRQLTSGLANTAVGDRALMSATTCSSATAIGSYALNKYTTGLNVVAIGSDSMTNATTATHSVAVGSDTLRTTVGAWGNTAIGHSVLFDNTTGEYNTAVGDRALLEATTGSYNIAIGHQAANLLTTGTSNVIIGSKAEAQSGVHASIVIGREATADVSNQFVVGSSLYPAGTLTSESLTANATWSVKINGQACKILINR